MPEEYEQGLKDQQKAYKKLDKIRGSEEFKSYFELLIKTVADKMIWTFSAGKDGDNIKSWEDFCRARGEIVARLQPIQQVYDAKAMLDHLDQQLKQYYADTKS